MFTEPLPTNDRLFWHHYSLFQELGGTYKRTYSKVISQASKNLRNSGKGIDRQQGEFTSLLFIYFFFQNKGSRLKRNRTRTDWKNVNSTEYRIKELVYVVTVERLHISK
jgi:hypothetical protein